MSAAVFTGRETAVAFVAVLGLGCLLVLWVTDRLDGAVRRWEVRREFRAVARRYRPAPPPTWPFDWSRSCPEIAQEPGWRVLRRG